VGIVALSSPPVEDEGYLRRRLGCVPRLHSLICHGESSGLSPSILSLPHGRSWMPLPAIVNHPMITPSTTTAPPSNISISSAYQRNASLA
jgi:hypothetical protein